MTPKERRKIEDKLETLRVDLGAELYSRAPKERIGVILSKIDRLQSILSNPERYDSQFSYNPDRFPCDRVWKDRLKYRDDI